MKRISVFELGAYDSNTADGVDKLIGFFSSIEKCNEVIERYKQLPGFNRSTCKFETTEYCFDVEETFQLSSVYYLQHEWEDDLYYHTTDIGVYLNRENAISEMNKLICSDDVEDKYFRMYPDGFTIDNYKIDEENWIYGFDSRKE